MTDKLTPGTNAFWTRETIWRHNSFHGHAVMMIANCNSIIESSTATGASKKIAREIITLAAELKISLKERA